MTLLSNMETKKPIFIRCIYFSFDGSSVFGSLQKLVRKLTVIYWLYLEIFWKNPCHNLLFQGLYYGGQPQIFENMDETAVFLEAKSSSTVHNACLNTISARWSERKPYF